MHVFNQICIDSAGNINCSQCTVCGWLSRSDKFAEKLVIYDDTALHAEQCQLSALLPNFAFLRQTKCITGTVHEGNNTRDTCAFPPAVSIYSGDIQRGK